MRRRLRGKENRVGSRRWGVALGVGIHNALDGPLADLLLPQSTDFVNTIFSTGELLPNFGNGRLGSTIAFSRTADETALAKAMGAPMNDERLTAEMAGYAIAGWERFSNERVLALSDEAFKPACGMRSVARE